MAPRLSAADRRSQLLEVARTEFARNGYHSTSMNDVADAAGVTKPVLYQHFNSKRALYLELLRAIGDRLREAVIEATSAASGPRDQVEKGIAAYFRFVTGEQDTFQVLFGGGTRFDEEFAAETIKVEDAIADVIADLIEVSGLPHPSRLLLAHGIVGLAEGTSRHWIDSEMTDDIEGAATIVADLAWRGLRSVGTEP